jgi:hypothetical protein
MKYNENILNEYGNFFEIIGTSPISTKVQPSKTDYKNGNFKRYFAKKINDNVIVEIDSKQVNEINKDLYMIVFVTWAITGPRDNRKLNGILEYGVTTLNKLEIDRVRNEEMVDLGGALSNLLEYWQGY